MHQSKHTRKKGRKINIKISADSTLITRNVIWHSEFKEQ